MRQKGFVEASAARGTNVVDAERDGKLYIDLNAAASVAFGISVLHAACELLFA